MILLDGLAFAGDMRFFVKDDDQIKAETKIRMPEKIRKLKQNIPIHQVMGM